MAEKTVAVRLVAMTSQYRQSMASATASTAKLGATAGGTAGKISGALGMGPVGIGTAAVLAGGAIVKLGLDYEESFAKIGAITNASQQQVGQWKDQVLTLSGETAQAPKDLADGLYFLASAGLDAAEIMPTLEASARAAAIGMGEMGDLTRIAANVINAFPEAGLKAADVFDTLTAAVREGTAEPNEFADALGRILPIASKAGVEFDEVAASLSTLSNIGLDVNEGVTAMRGLMQSLFAPTAKARDVMDELGISADQLRSMLAEKGLISTLRFLEERTGGNIDKMQALVPNIRALTGAFGLTAQEAKKVDEIFRQVAQSTGDLDSAFKKTEKGEGFQMRKALNEIRVEATRAGEDALPILADAVQLLGDVLGPVLYDLHLFLEGLGDLARGDLPGAAARLEGFTYFFDQLVLAFQEGRMSADEVAAKIRQVGRDIGYTAEENAKLNHLLIQLEGNTQKAGLAAAGFGGNLGNLVAPAATEVGGAAGKMDRALDGANDEMKRGERLAGTLEAALGALAGSQLEAQDAAIGWEQALDDAFDELKKGDKTLNLDTQAGRDNAQAIDDAAQAAIDHGVAVAQQTGSLQKGVKATRSHIRELIDQAQKAGLSEDAIYDYIRQLNLTPKQISTLIKANVSQAKNDVQTYLAMLRSAPKRYRFYVDTAFTSSREGGGEPLPHAGGTVGSFHARRLHMGGELRGDEEWFIGQRGERLLSAREYATLRQITGAGATSTPTQTKRPERYTFNVYVGNKKVDAIVVDALNRAVRRV